MNELSLQPMPGAQGSPAGAGSAVELWAAEVVSHPSDARAYLELGRALAAAEMPREARTALEASFALDPTLGWYDLARAYEDDRQYHLAFDVWSKRLEFLRGLRPGAGCLDNERVPYPLRVKAQGEIEKRVARMGQLRAQARIREALAESKSAVTCWSRAFRVQGEGRAGA